MMRSALVLASALLLFTLLAVLASRAADPTPTAPLEHVQAVPAPTPPRPLQPTTTTTAKPTTTTTTKATRNATRTTAPTPCGGYRQLVTDVGLPPIFCSVIRCETGGTYNPASRNGSSTGLAQLHRRWHQARAARLGFTWTQMTQPRPNLTVAADLYDEQGLAPWRFSQYCWGKAA